MVMELFICTGSDRTSEDQHRCDYNIRCKSKHKEYFMRCQSVAATNNLEEGVRIWSNAFDLDSDD